MGDTEKTLKDTKESKGSSNGSGELKVTSTTGSGDLKSSSSSSGESKVTSSGSGELKIAESQYFSVPDLSTATLSKSSLIDEEVFDTDAGVEITVESGSSQAV